MAEKGHLSSMTSVTGEDSSIDSESDTTESTHSSMTSSGISTDTDDKLTPSLGGISITTLEEGSLQMQSSKRICVSSPSAAYAMGLKPVKFNYREGAIKHCGNDRKHGHGGNHFSQKPTMSKKIQLKDSNVRRSLLCGGYPASVNLKFSRNASHENLGVEDLENKLSTDFSDTSSIAVGDDCDLRVEEKAKIVEAKVNDNDGETSDDGVSSEGEECEGSTWEPDMTSSNWYKAGCFSHYWRHYRFVMAWYREHMNAVNCLYSGLTRTSSSKLWSFGKPGFWERGPNLSASDMRHGKSSRSRHKRRRRRARNRRLVKERKREACSPPVSAKEEDKTMDLTAKVEDPEEFDVDMEISEDVMDFFKTTLKHQMERDAAKNNTASESQPPEIRVNIEDAVQGHTGPSTAAPQERPGARRAKEMKELYGEGAPMIHGMETALQMNYDRVQDKFQPKLWPNMPLRIVFG